MITIIFICMGNICRSPMAEAIFSDMVKKAGLSKYFEIDSAGTSGYHVGDRPCKGTQEILARHNIEYNGRSRRVSAGDLNYFDYILTMDADNLADLEYLDKGGKNWHKFHKLLDFSTQSAIADVPDPYYEGRFEYVYDLILDGCRGLLAHIRREHNL